MEAPERLSDESLVDAYKATATVECAREIDRRLRRRVYSRCRQILHNDAAAEDVTQEVMLAVFSHIAQFGRGVLWQWVRRIAYNRCLNYLSSSTQTHETTVEFLPDLPSDGDSLQSSQERSEQVRKILCGLPAPQRQCLKLFYIEGYSYEEIAVLTAFPLRDVKRYLEEGRRRFRKAWENTQ